MPMPSTSKTVSPFWSAERSWASTSWMGSLGGRRRQVVGLGVGAEQQVQHVPDAGEGTEEHQRQADEDLLSLELVGILGVDCDRQQDEDQHLHCPQNHPE